MESKAGPDAREHQGGDARGVKQLGDRHRHQDWVPASRLQPGPRGCRMPQRRSGIFDRG
jgi:hypothetical protein